MHQVTLFGAGKIGEAIAAFLARTKKYKVVVCDINAKRAKDVAAQLPNCQGHGLTLDSRKATQKLLKGSKAVISALPFHCNVGVATAAEEAGVHYFDLTEDIQTAKQIQELASSTKKNVCFMPQCGLAPGFISVAAFHLISSFVEVETVKMRVGALPIYPSNRLKYNLTWSTEGLINEYGNLCTLIDDGKIVSTLPLEGYERFSLDGIEYEAFNTSGGLGSLCETMQGKVRKLDYKSVRYPGHRDLVAFLMQDLKFNFDRDTLCNVFERSISITAQDKCIIFVDVVGTVKGRLKQRTYASTVYNNVIGGRHFGAIQITTACGVCAPVDMLLNGKIKKRKGFLKAEDIQLTDFLANQFGRYYRDEKALSGILA